MFECPPAHQNVLQRVVIEISSHEMGQTSPERFDWEVYNNSEVSYWIFHDLSYFLLFSKLYFESCVVKINTSYNYVNTTMNNTQIKWHKYCPALYFFYFLQFPLHQHSFSHSDVDGLCLCLAAAGMEIISQRLSWYQYNHSSRFGCHNYRVSGLLGRENWPVRST